VTLLKQVLLPLFLSSLLLAFGPVSAVRAYSVGFGVGAQADYESAAMGRFRMTIVGINGTAVDYVMDGESAPTPWPSPFDVKSTAWFDPVQNWGRYPPFIASNLGIGNRVYDSLNAPMIQNSSEAPVLGVVREMNQLRIDASPYGGSSRYRIDLTYDKVTGFLVEVNFTARGAVYEARMIHTNLWQPNTAVITATTSGPITVTPSSTNFQDWGTLGLIAMASVGLCVAVAIICRRK
jgi:hypothetical protein